MIWQLFVFMRRLVLVGMAAGEVPGLSPGRFCAGAGLFMVLALGDE
jgi:hypothetical protein